MHFNEAMQQLADRIGFDGLRPDPRGEYSLVFDDDLKVRCAPIGKSLLLRGSIGPRATHPPQAEDQLKKLLRHSLATMKDHPEIVSLDPAGDEFILHRTLALEDARIDDLEQALGDYLNRLEYWRRLCGGTARREPALPLLFP
ncbi:hypothetical protein BN873_490022 [Candidatus Competibacter denitrificans Run_A_D11]|jgi:hypothetical protein|uniref:Type III secretion chaperone, CesT family n=1 Tax=Candidatus Competibacter denitrificans Run_A_D11 TaxID=1400863 RepID=W6MDT3_9GAMM|nr:CesT family type III secretion system chaperone [Candidatus Competibacter denitrificans]CDI03413.1 hypothetical protein BN873_490022 [Candidatus Competibacter denitrificans Run_A_D11]